MLETIDAALTDYEAKWQRLVDARADKAFFEGLKPTEVGWKLADRTEYDKALATLHDQASHIVETWMNGRWVAKVLLRDAKLHNGIQIIKLMQRRPGSSDAIGLDHVTFYSPAVTTCEPILEKEPNLNWSHESNDIVAGYGWISLWFDGTEAKLKDDTVLDIIMVELQEVKKQIVSA